MTSSFFIVIVLAPPAIGDAIQAWPLLHALQESGCGVLAEPAVSDWFEVYLGWRPFSVHELNTNANAARVIDLNGSDEVLEALGRCGAAQVVGFAPSEVYTEVRRFIREEQSLYDWHVELGHWLGLDLPLSFPLVRPVTLKGRKYILLVPHASVPDKNWPISRFVELANVLVERGRDVLWMLPHKSMAYSAEAVSLPHGVRTFEPETWHDTFPAIDNAASVVANDGSPMHIAAAQGIPVVGIFIRSAKSIWFPYPQDSAQALGSGNFERPEGNWCPDVQEVLDALDNVESNQ